MTSPDGSTVTGVNEIFGLSPVWSRTVASIVVLAVVLILRYGGARFIGHRVSDPELQFRARKALTYGATAVMVTSLTFIWLPFVDGLATFLGLLSAGLAIALADVFLNLAGWVYIVFRRPFRVGDRIEIGGSAGDVIDIRAFRFTLLEIRDWVDADQSTGRVIHVPNGHIFRESAANFTEGFHYIWHEVPMLVTFESDWKAAERYMMTALSEVAIEPGAARKRIEQVSASRDYRINYTQLTPITYVSTRDSGVLLTGRVLVEARTRRGIEDAIWRSLLDAIHDDPTVELAYPTIRGFIPELNANRREEPDLGTP